jgi:putative transposase
MVAGGHYHVISRGNNRATVFESSADYESFLALVGHAQRRLELGLLAYCLMPNHFHLVIAQRHAGDISRWMHWLLTTFGAHHHDRHESCGRLWQGRFKAFPIEQDGHLLTVMRYVERNALRAGLVPRAEDWPWGSLARRNRSSQALLSRPPLPLPSGWLDWVNAAQSAEELAALRDCVNRQRPYGGERWVNESADRLGLRSSVRPRGRPRKMPPAANLATNSPAPNPPAEKTGMSPITSPITPSAQKTGMSPISAARP